MTTELHNVEIPRDRYGRPMVMPPNNTKRVAYRRCTTFVGALEDTYNLMAWKTRQVAFGMGQRKDLVLAAAAADPDDKPKLNEIADKATEHALAGAAATTGTALHALTERIDRGQPLGYVPQEYEADIKAYEQATKKIDWTGVETFRVHDDWKVAGTADRIGVAPDSRLRIYDIKTGSIDYPHKMAMQLAMYAHSVPYDIPTDTRQPAENNLDMRTGIIIHLPAGQGRCDLYEIDIHAGWGACQIAKQVWEWRGIKNLTTLIDIDAQHPSTLRETVIRAAQTVDELRLIWKRLADNGQLTEELRALCVQRSSEIAAVTTK